MRFRFSKATLLKVIAFTVLSAFATLLLAMKIGNFQFFSQQLLATTEQKI